MTMDVLHRRKEVYPSCSESQTLKSNATRTKFGFEGEVEGSRLSVIHASFLVLGDKTEVPCDEVSTPVQRGTRSGKLDSIDRFFQLSFERGVSPWHALTLTLQAGVVSRSARLFFPSPPSDEIHSR